jgi:hypothetical protein
MKDIFNQTPDLKEFSIQKNISEIILKASSEINEADIPRVIKEFTDYFKAISARGRAPALIRINDSKNDKPEKEKIPRVVIIGDLHNDFNALGTILNKLALSPYDYFNNAILIFAGDYVDRGSRPLETLRLIFAMKKLLGDRCILLQGNHEQIKFIDSKLRSEVFPAETAEDIMNKYFTPEVNKLYSEYCRRLPYAVSLNQADKKYLICHGSIPKDDSFPLFNVEKLSQLMLPADEKSVISVMLKEMVWGDPVEYDRKMQESVTRFEFGRLQFEEFMKEKNFDFLIRSHEPADFGIKESFDKHLFTVFSSGGSANTDTAYSDEVHQPAFIILREDGTIAFESIFDFGLLSSAPFKNVENCLYKFNIVHIETTSKIENKEKKLSFFRHIIKKDNSAKIFPQDENSGSYEVKKDINPEDPIEKPVNPNIFLNEEFYIDPVNPPKFLEEFIVKITDNKKP